MLPHQSVGIAVWRTGWEIKQFQHSTRCFDKRLRLFRNVCKAPVNNQINRFLCADDQPLQKFDKQYRAEPVLDKRGYHLARPLRELKLQLHRILPRHCAGNPIQLPTCEFQEPSLHRPGFQRALSDAPVKCPPIVDRCAIESQSFADNFSALLFLHQSYRPNAQSFQGSVIRDQGHSEHSAARQHPDNRRRVRPEDRPERDRGGKLAHGGGT